MRLAVLSSAPAHEISSWVTKHFSDVPVCYPGVPPATRLPVAPADSIAANFDQDWFRMSVTSLTSTSTAPLPINSPEPKTRFVTRKAATPLK